MIVVSRKISPVFVESVTVTLSANEVQQLLNCIDYQPRFENDSIKFALQQAIKPMTSTLSPAEILDNGVMDGDLRLGRKISAIKHLRYLTGCGLKEGKDAVDDYVAAKGW